jgi:hypothetical protein
MLMIAQVRSKTCTFTYQRISENGLKNRKGIEEEATSFFA